MAKEEKVEFEGEVVEALPNAMFRVQLDNGHNVLGHVAGKMRRYRIRILPGDRVRVALVVPESLDSDDVLSIARGLERLAAQTGTTIAGGDLVRGAALTISVTVV